MAPDGTREQPQNGGTARRKVARDEKRVTKGFGPKIRRSFARIPFAREAVAAFFCARDPATPLHVKGTLLAALAYFIMPLDLIPDFIAVLGYTDDASVFWAAWKTMSKYVTEIHRLRAADYLADLHDDAQGDR